MPHTRKMPHTLGRFSDVYHSCVTPVGTLPRRRGVTSEIDGWDDNTHYKAIYKEYSKNSESTPVPKEVYSYNAFFEKALGEIILSLGYHFWLVTPSLFSLWSSATSARGV